jgi:hypothetical protein
MDSKLTLSIDKDLAEKAKLYARSQGRSLSDLVENYFKVITSGKSVAKFKISPGMKALKGVFKVPSDYDYKKELSNAKTEKYLK